MLPKRPVAFKSMLPLTLIASPLLLAAARPIDLEPHQFSCNVLTNIEARSTSDREASTQYFGEREGHASASDSTGIGGPSLGKRWAIARRLLLSNPYMQAPNAAEGIPNTPATAPTENNCLAQLQPANEALVVQALPSSEGPLIIAQEPDLLPVLGAPPAGPIPAPTSPPILSPTPPTPAAPIPVTPSPRTTPAPIRPSIRTSPVPRPVPPANNNTPSGFPQSRPLSVDPTNVTPTTVNPTPFDGSTIQTLAARPDGNYRYVSGNAESRAYTDAEIRQRGSAVFVLRKEGNRVTGDLRSRIGQPGICVTGIVSGDTIAGSAYPYSPVEPQQVTPASGGSFESYGGGALQVRQLKTVTKDEQVGAYYASATLDLSDFSMINAGSSLPPESCSATLTDKIIQD